MPGMSTLDPKDYFNGERIAAADVSLVKGETVSSAGPSVELGPAKAIVAAIGSGLVGGLTALGAALTDNVVTPAEWVAVALGLIVGSGIVGGATYVASTKVTGR
ncbi:hypothetical protein [Parasutterella excrementihominis]|uniref:hypothetical protein n=1 Tax=Parasutterella excrementihominis TaxID=487175 RepID=UPI0015679F64|nr:hypothetical protein [Parasutterella excrementihominis]